MAEEEELELDTEALGGDGAPKKSGLKKMLVISLVLILLLAGGGGVAWFLLGGEDGDETADGAVERPKGPPIYMSFEPALVVNFLSPGRARYLQLGIEILAYDQEVINAVKLHMPAIRNDLIMVFSEKTFEELATREGKEEAKEEAHAVINRIISERGVAGEVDDVFFTSFVMQ